jgi:hypothetical protein
MAQFCGLCMAGNASASINSFRIKKKPTYVYSVYMERYCTHLQF